MNVGDYVRTKSYGIAKILNTYNNTTTNYSSITLDIIDCFGRLGVSVGNNDIIKSSPNIIDLIEVGDILYLEESDDIACMFFKDIYLVKNEDNLLNIISDIKNKKCKLISIVTKEQFESMEYKVGE